MKVKKRRYVQPDGNTETVYLLIENEKVPTYKEIIRLWTSHGRRFDKNELWIKISLALSTLSVAVSAICVLTD